MDQRIKQWLKYIGGVAVISSSSYTSGLLVGGKTAPAPSVDCKGQICIVQTKYDKNGDRGQIIYTPDEFNAKTSDDLIADIQKRISDKKKFIEEQSKKVTPQEDEVIE